MLRYLNSPSITANPQVLRSLAAALYCISATSWAQSPPQPDAGQVLRDLQQSPLLPAPRPAPLQKPDVQPEIADNDKTSVRVLSFTITGNQEVPTATLQNLLAGLAGTQQTLGQLNEAARRITAYYRSQGFAVARAYLPAQDVTDGTVIIAVVEGRIAGTRLNNQSRVSNERVNAYFGNIKNGDVIRSENVDRGLLLLQDTPGIGNSRATLQPGASVGTSELLIETDPVQAYNGNAALDNYGSRYTGEYRTSASFNLASPLNIGDQLGFTALTSGNALSFGRIAYQLPVGSNGLRVGAAYFDTRYKLGKEFANLQAHGNATSSSLFAAYPLIRSQFKNLNTTLSVEGKHLRDEDANVGMLPKKLMLTSLGLSGNIWDGLGGGASNNFELGLVTGKLSINSSSALALDAAAQTNGRYSKLSYAVSRLQRLSDASQLWLSFSGQQAGKNLDSSEKFSLGGVNGVRAYPQGEASGDEGHRFTLELRHSLATNLQGLLFYDMGKISINRNPYGATTSNSRELAGAGIGLNAAYKAFSLRTALAWRTSGGLPATVPASAAKRPTLWMQGVFAF